MAHAFRSILSTILVTWRPAGTFSRIRETYVRPTSANAGKSDVSNARRMEGMRGANAVSSPASKPALLWALRRVVGEMSGDSLHKKRRERRELMTIEYQQMCGSPQA
jgi:hypothetical protein